MLLSPYFPRFPGNLLIHFEAIYMDLDDRITLPAKTTLSTVHMEKVP